MDDYNYNRNQKFHSQNSENPMALISPLFFGFWSFAPIYLFCEFGESVSNHFYEFNNAIYQCDWYLFPLDVRQMLPLIMMNSQQSITLQGFGNTVCNRNSFKNVRTNIDFWHF